MNFLQRIGDNINAYKNFLSNFDRFEKEYAEQKEYEIYCEKCIKLTNEYISRYLIENVDSISEFISQFTKDYFGLEFKIEIDTLKDNVIAEALVRENEKQEFHTIPDNNGGGLVDFVSLLLRLIFLERSKNMKILILDEAFKGVSDKYTKEMINVIKDVVEKLNIQISMVTHKPEYAMIGHHVIIVNSVPEKMEPILDEIPSITFLKN